MENISTADFYLLLVKSNIALFFWQLYSSAAVSSFVFFDGFLGFLLCFMLFSSVKFVILVDSFLSELEKFEFVFYVDSFGWLSLIGRPNCLASSFYTLRTFGWTYVSVLGLFILAQKSGRTNSSSKLSLFLNIG